ncbi:MAG: iron-containing alcohol dehydrogenase, partial [Quisquiliibacterium sp.]
QWNAQTLGDALSAISEALGAPGQPAHQVVREFISDLGLPGTLAQVGIREADFEAIAKAGVDHPVVQANPRPVTGIDDLMAILRLAA